MFKMVGYVIAWANSKMIVKLDFVNVAEEISDLFDPQMGYYPDRSSLREEVNSVEFMVCFVIP